MQIISISSILPYSTEKMYFLVNDVNSYYKFIPNCIGSRILEKKNNYMIASIDILSHGIQKTFVTKNILYCNKKIKIKTIKNNFFYLSGNWDFIKLNKSMCLIKLNIKYRLFNLFFDNFCSFVLQKTIKNTLKSFNQRASEIFYE